MNVKRTGLTAITARGSDTLYTISHDGGTCNSAFVLVARLLAAPTGIDYGGETMTKLGTMTNSDNWTIEIWGIQSPPVGTQDVEIACGTAENLIAGVVSYNLTDSTATFPNVTGNDKKTFGDGADTVTVSVTTTVDNCFLLGLGMHVGLAADALSPGTGTTEVSFYNPGSGTDAGIYESDPFDTGTAGSKSLQITLGSTNQDMALLVVAIAPSLSNPRFFRKPI